MIDPSRIRSVPTRPGCYLFKNADGETLYVGKASSLRTRLRSYFSNVQGQSAKVRAMLAQAVDVETIVTDSEMEALILENNLIKERRPKYNVRLRDDKQYPYICVTLQEPYPRVLKVRRVRNDGAAYFGPFADGSGFNETLAAVKKLFPYRSCDLVIPDEAERPEPVLDRPCLEYFIKRCVAPCVRYASRDEYRGIIDQVLLVLQGKYGDVLKQLQAQMQEAAENLNFERAAQVRDQISSLEMLAGRQKITSVKAGDHDVIALAQEDAEACVEVFNVRDGKVVARDHFLLEAAEGEPRETLASFVKLYYQRATHLPREILLQHDIDDAGLVASWLQSLRGGAVRLTVPRIGERRRLVELVAENAREALEAHKLRWMNDAQKTTGALLELQEELGLENALNRIECYDISNIQGTSAVGSMVVFERGKAKNAEYRRFKIKTVEGANDFAMMAEMLRRRFKRVETSSNDESFGHLPDLIIVDGGKGQLHAATEVLAELGRGDLAIVSLAKRLEELWVPGRQQSVLLPRTSQALYLVQRIRDEAHRFALSYHRNVRQKSAVASQIDGVPGVGPARRKALMRAFGSVRGVKAATAEEIAAVPGMNARLAQTVKEHLGSAP
ncbi:MAG TPA: excinuclease ABC subunit UvrC [Chloroflexota bacterium]|nr:excinuclease ABC subunit UvrC [Chloroflexota bacterium]